MCARKKYVYTLNALDCKILYEDDLMFKDN